MSTLLERVAAAWALLGGLVLLAIVGVTVVNAGAFTADRVAALFGATVAGLPGYEDFVRLAVAAASPMFLPYCQVRRGHLAVDILMNAAPRRVQQIADALWLLLLAAAALFLGYWMVIGMFETRADNVLSRVLGWVEWPFYIPGIVSLVLWAAVALSQLRDPSGASPEPADG
jgi:TRAP-type C4-dicarboxylate transport system permease small subunit